MERLPGAAPDGAVVTTNCSTQSTPVFVEVREREGERGRERRRRQVD